MKILYMGPEAKVTNITDMTKKKTNSHFTYTGYLSSAENFPKYERINNYNYFVVDVDTQPFSANTIESYLKSLINQGIEASKIIIKGSGYSNNCELFERVRELSINSIISSDIVASSAKKLFNFVKQGLYDSTNIRIQNVA